MQNLLWNMMPKLLLFCFFSSGVSCTIFKRLQETFSILYFSTINFKMDKFKVLHITVCACGCGCLEAENTHDTKTVKPHCTRGENLPIHHREKLLMIIFFFFFTSHKHVNTMAVNTHWTFCEKRLSAACVHS